MFSSFFAEYFPLNINSLDNKDNIFNGYTIQHNPLINPFLNFEEDDTEDNVEDEESSINIPDINEQVVIQSDPVQQDSTKQTSPTQHTSQNASLRQNIVNTARRHVGGKYIWGGNGMKDKKGGFDCSGLIFYAYTQNGADRKKMPRKSSLFENHGKKISLEQAQIGDIIHTKGHVLMLSQKVNGEWWVIEAAGRNTGIVERPISQSAAGNPKNIISVRNYVDYLNNGGKLIPRYKYL